MQCPNPLFWAISDPYPFEKRQVFGGHSDRFSRINAPVSNNQKCNQF